MISFGWKKDIYSNDDYKFNQIKTGLTKLSLNNSNEYIINNTLPVYHQYSLQSCVANSVCHALEMLMSQHGQYTPLSRLFVYWNARMFNNETNLDEGTYIRNAFSSLRTLGVCSEKSFPYYTYNVFAQPGVFSYGEAASNKIDSFYRINSYDTQRLDDIELAIRANHPVCFGTAVDRDFVNADDDKEVWDKPSSWIGKHAMLICGVRTNNYKREFLIKNSWGTSWGNGGYMWLSERYIIWDESEDFWVATLMPDLIV